MPYEPFPVAQHVDNFMRSSSQSEALTSIGVITYTLSAPTTTTLGGVKRNVGGLNEFVNGVDIDGSLLYDTLSSQPTILSNPSVAYVRSDGNDGIAELGNPGKPYLTAQAAWNDGATSFDFGRGSFSISYTSNVNTDQEVKFWIRGQGVEYTDLNIVWIGTNGLPGANGTDGDFPGSGEGGFDGSPPVTLTIHSDQSVSVNLTNTGGNGGPGGNGGSGGESIGGNGGNGGNGAIPGNFNINGVWLESATFNGGAAGPAGSPGVGAGGTGSFGFDGGVGATTPNSVAASFSSDPNSYLTASTLTLLGVIRNGVFITS